MLQYSSWVLEQLLLYEAAQHQNATDAVDWQLPTPILTSPPISCTPTTIFTMVCHSADGWMLDVIWPTCVARCLQLEELPAQPEKGADPHLPSLCIGSGHGATAVGRAQGG